MCGGFYMRLVHTTGHAIKRMERYIEPGGILHGATQYDVVDQLLESQNNCPDDEARDKAIIFGAGLLFPKLAHRPKALASTKVHAETLRRIATHLKDRLPEYRRVSIFLNSYIEAHTPRIYEPLKSQLSDINSIAEAISNLSAEPTDSEDIHRVLKKVSSAASALLHFYQIEIDQLTRDNKQLHSRVQVLEKKVSGLTRRRVVVTDTAGVDSLQLTAKLLRFKDNGHLPEFHTIRGRGAQSPEDWIRENLRGKLRTEELECAVGDKAVWFHVDKKLYRSMNERDFRQRRREKKVELAKAA
jgi:hypothetical protein